MEPSPYHNWKRVWELPVALLLAPPALMMTLPLILLVRLTSKGPGIYKQTRSGLNGKTFTMYKLRSMRIDAEADGLPKWAAGDKDKRITKVGYWLRKLHLDELPQIINVIRGDMSFCGPRPERPEIVKDLENGVPYYLSRLAVRPGITGYSQINLPADDGLVSVIRKQMLDMEYIENATVYDDVRMVACTALRLVGVPGSLATKLAGLTMRPEESRFSHHYCDLITQHGNKIEKEKVEG